MSIPAFILKQERNLYDRISPIKRRRITIYVVKLHKRLTDNNYMDSVALKSLFFLSQFT